MIDPGMLAQDLERNTWIVKAQAEGLSHADSLLQTEHRINCLNWVLGHLLEGRGVMLGLLGVDRVVPASDTARYRKESEPILEDGPGVLPLQDLLAGLEQTQAVLSGALADLDAAAMAVETEDDSGKSASLGARLHFRYFHDTYHTGQTELLRQLTGIGDKVI